MFLAIDDAMLEEVLVLMPRRQQGEGGEGAGAGAGAAQAGGDDDDDEGPGGVGEEHDIQAAQVREGRLIACGLQCRRCMLGDAC